MNNDNVLILGAGFSYSAGIPLMKGFVERMWEFAIRGTNEGKPLSKEDHEILKNAIKVRNELDRYHGRVAFDDRNIEDILSILSFNALGGTGTDTKKLNWIIKAITRTIELTCSVRRSDNYLKIEDFGPSVYREFWHQLFKISKSGLNIPTILTFNYDLVLERSLIQTLVNDKYFARNKPFPSAGVSLKYHYDNLKDYYYIIKYDNQRAHGGGNTNFTTIQQIVPEKEEYFENIELLKLHGSLNFPSKKPNNPTLHSLTEVVDRPYVLPPIFNKLSNNKPLKMWKIALQRLRMAKNVIIVGYSLPRTDIYMQYFLKAALGPNLNLNKIFIFDPVLFKDNGESEDMKRRYEECFSPQLRDRIVYQPPLGGKSSGSLAHLVDQLTRYPADILF